MDRRSLICPRRQRFPSGSAVIQKASRDPRAPPVEAPISARAGESSRAIDAENLRQASLVRCDPSAFPHELEQHKRWQVKPTTTSVQQHQSADNDQGHGPRTLLTNLNFGVWYKAIREKDAQAPLEVDIFFSNPRLSQGMVPICERIY
jgi:hypothetical protein